MLFTIKYSAQGADGFFGEIEKEEDGSFRGFVVPDENSEDYAIRYLRGAFCEIFETGKIGVAFYEFINEPEGWPSLYIIPDIEDGNGSCYAYKLFAAEKWTPGASVSAEIHQVPFVEERKKRILQTFSRFNPGNNPHNYELVNADLCPLYAQIGSI